MIQVVNKRFYKGGGIYIPHSGRPSILGNPITLREFGTIERVKEAYEEWLPVEYNKKGALYYEIHRLKVLASKGDLTLVCWCVPLWCHGQTLKKLIEWLILKEK